MLLHAAATRMRAAASASTLLTAQRTALTASNIASGVRRIDAASPPPCCCGGLPLLHPSALHTSALAQWGDHSSTDVRDRKGGYDARAREYGRDRPQRQQRFDRSEAPGYQQRTRDNEPSEHDEKSKQSARGKWFELEFVFGGPTRPFAILHKPAGLGVQGRYQTDSVEKRLRQGYGVSEVYFPHRLDKHTSGLLVVAFSRTASRELGQSMERGQWEKRYRALLVVPPAVDMEFKPLTEEQVAAEAAQASTAATTEDGDSNEQHSPRPIAVPPILPFTPKFPARLYPASSLISSYLTGSLWGAVPLPSLGADETGAAESSRSTDLAGRAVPVKIFLRPQATLRSYIGRRPLPAYTRIDEAHEWGKWMKAVQPLPANKVVRADDAPSALAREVGSFVAASPSKDGLAYNSSPSLDRRRLHPFVPETMLYESVPFRPIAHDPTREGGGSRHRRRAGEAADEPSEDIDEAEMEAAEQLEGGAASSSSSARVDPPKKSVSTFTLLKSNPHTRLALYDVHLGTGRSHQIRIHASDAGSPVLNDPYYNQYSVSGWMRKAQRLRLEDAMAKRLREKMARERGGAANVRPITLDEISAAADAEEAAVAAAGYTTTSSDATSAAPHPLVLPPPSLEPLVPPAFSLPRVSPDSAAPVRRSSGSRVSLSQGTLPSTSPKDAGGNNGGGKAGSASTGWHASQSGAAARPNKHLPRHARIPRKYGVRTDRRSFATQTRRFMAAYMSPLLADSNYYSSRGGDAAGRQGSSQSKPRWSPDNFKRAKAERLNDADEEELPRGSSSVGQGGGGSYGGVRKGRQTIANEYDEYDDDSERRVLPRDGGQRNGSSGSQSQSGNGRRDRSAPRLTAAQRAARAEHEESEETKLFEHKVAYGGRGGRKPPKPLWRQEQEEADEHDRRHGRGHRSQTVDAEGRTLRYTNRHDAPKRPHWLPEHVPYKYVAPNPAVDEQWAGVLSKYGVGKQQQHSSSEAELALRDQVPYTAAQRYANMERGAGAVGWLAKTDTAAAGTGGSDGVGATASASSPSGLLLPSPAVNASAGVSGGDHHWFASQVASPAHEMGLQAYFLRLPHPTRRGEIITVEQAMPKQWQRMIDTRGGQHRAHDKHAHAEHAAEQQTHTQADADDESVA